MKGFPDPALLTDYTKQIESVQFSIRFRSMTPTPCGSRSQRHCCDRTISSVLGHGCRSSEHMQIILSLQWCTGISRIPPRRFIDLLCAAKQNSLGISSPASSSNETHAQLGSLSTPLPSPRLSLSLSLISTACTLLLEE